MRSTALYTYFSGFYNRSLPILSDCEEWTKLAPCHSFLPSTADICLYTSGVVPRLRSDFFFASCSNPPCKNTPQFLEPLEFPLPSMVVVFNDYGIEDSDLPVASGAQKNPCILKTSKTSALLLSFP